MCKNFDMDSKYNEYVILKIDSLISELQQEMGEHISVEEYDKMPSNDAIRRRFKSSDKSGIIDRLKGNLGFDIEIIAKTSKKEKFDMFRLLKRLYNIEKVGKNKKYPVLKERKIRIIDILAKPRLANIETSSGISGEYGEIFEELYSDIKSQVAVDIAESRVNELNHMALEWERLILNIMQLTYMDYALNNQERTLKILNGFKQYLDKLLKKQPFSDKSFKKLPYKEGIMDTFFNILCCHRIKCVFGNFLNIDYNIVEKSQSEQYCERLKEHEWEIVPYLLTENILKYVKTGKILKREIKKCYEALNDKNISVENVESMIKSDYEYILSLIYYNLDLKEIDSNEFSFAVNNLKNMLKIWIPRPDKNAPPYNEIGVTFTVFITAMQELIMLYHTKEEYYDDFVGYKYPKTFTSIIKKPETNAVMLGILRKKLQNRYAYNLGGQKQLKIIREIEKDIYRIIDYIFSFQNYEDLVTINNILYSDISHRFLQNDESAEPLSKKHSLLTELGF